MGWTVYYEAIKPRSFTEEEINWLRNHVKNWSSKLAEGSEEYRWYLDELPNKFWGFTKIHYSEEPEQDFGVLVGALQEIEKEFPDIEIKMSDDYYLHNEQPLVLGDPETAIDRLEN